MKAVVLAFDRLSTCSLGSYGNGEVRTPRLDRLAAEAVVFDQHFGENFDPAARNHAWWTGCHQFPQTPEQQSACPHVADLLRAAGVQTWMIQDSSGKNLFFGETRFDHVQTVDTALDDEAFRSECRDAICEWALESPSPGLLWWQNPGLSSPEPEGSAERLDRRLGIVLDCLDELTGGNLLTIVTAAEGNLRKDRSEFLSGARPLAEEQVHTPLLIRDAQTRDVGSRRQSLVQTIDLPPTLLDWFGVADHLPAGEGRSLLPLLRSEATDPHDCLFLGTGTETAAIRTSDWYLIGRAVRSDETGRIHLPEPGRLFVKPDDVWDLQEIAAQEPQVAADLTKRLEEFLAR